jgi:hypothetical protein
MKAFALVSHNTFVYFWLGILSGAVVVLTTMMLNSLMASNTRADLLRGEYDYTYDRSYDTSGDYSRDYTYEEPTVYDERSYTRDSAEFGPQGYREFGPQG